MKSYPISALLEKNIDNFSIFRKEIIFQFYDINCNMSHYSIAKLIFVADRIDDIFPGEFF